MKKNSTVQPLSENTRKAIIIAAIVVVAVIILSVALALILKPTVLSPDDQQTPGSGSSSLSIRNGDFEYTSSEDTAFPKTAQNWTRYGYKKASGSSHDFESISGSDKAVMGIVNVSENSEDEENWASVEPDLKAAGLTVKNPGVHEKIEDGSDDNNNVYMIATKEPTAASILSDSASVSSGASVKITIRLNTAQLKDGSEAVVMIQKSTISAKAENWYAYNFHIAKLDATSPDTDANGWQEFTFHIFNREASTKYIRVSIGIGNVYSGEEGSGAEDADNPTTGEGILFIDDITYETVTANDYRKVVDSTDATPNSYKIIENEDITDESKYLTLEEEPGTVLGSHTTLTKYTEAEAFAEAAGKYSPFTNHDDFYKDAKEGEERVETGFTIYKLSHDGNKTDKALALRLNASQLNGDDTQKNIDVRSSLLLKDHHHISFWVRVDQENKAAFANVYVQRLNEQSEWEDVNSNSNWTLVTTSQEIEEDANCGWVKYDVYLKPSANPEQISILFVLGNKKGYTEREQELNLIPEGSMYVTSPAYENISYNDYNSASGGNYVKKLDLVGTSASTSITNGSFSVLDSTGRQPSGWTPAYAGDNSIYRDGKGNEFGSLDRLAKTISGSGTVQGYEKAVSHSDGTKLDDEQQNVLKIENKSATSFGYFSSDIILSSKTAYVISAMFRTDTAGLAPKMYLLNTDTSLNRDKRIIASVTKQQSAGINVQLLGFDYGDNDFADGWMRCYMIVVTGDESMTVRLALFNGSLTEENKTASGTVYYDKVEMRTLGTYSFVEDEENENATHYKVEWTSHPYITATKATVEAYGKNFGELLTKQVSESDTTLLLTSWGIEFKQPTAEEWDTMTLIPEEETPNDGNTDTDTEEKEPREVDWGLLFSVISSVALVAALLVVFVIKVYKNKGRINKVA